MGNTTGHVFKFPKCNYCTKIGKCMLLRLPRHLHHRRLLLRRQSHHLHRQTTHRCRRLAILNSSVITIIITPA